MKSSFKFLLKLFISYIAFFVVVPYYLLYKIFRVKYKTVSIMVSKWSGFFGLLIRQHFYNFTLNKCGKNLEVQYGAYIVYPEVEIGDNCAIEEYSIVSLCTMGHDVVLSARVSIMSGSKHHDIDDLTTTFMKTKSNTKRVIIGNNVWIGTHAVIMEDISSETAVAAGAVVNKKFDEYVLIGGVPAKVIRKRGNDEKK